MLLLWDSCDCKPRQGNRIQWGKNANLNYLTVWFRTSHQGHLHINSRYPGRQEARCVRLDESTQKVIGRKTH